MWCYLCGEGREEGVELVLFLYFVKKIGFSLG